MERSYLAAAFSSAKITPFFASGATIEYGNLQGAAHDAASYMVERMLGPRILHCRLNTRTSSNSPVMSYDKRRKILSVSSQSGG
jgi:hypothetical protein